MIVLKFLKPKNFKRTIKSTVLNSLTHKWYHWTAHCLIIPNVMFFWWKKREEKSYERFFAATQFHLIVTFLLVKIFKKKHHIHIVLDFGFNLSYCTCIEIHFSRFDGSFAQQVWRFQKKEQNQLRNRQQTWTSINSKIEHSSQISIQGQYNA